METVIERFRFAHLRNMEYVQVVLRIEQIVDRHDPGTLRLERSLNRVRAFLPDLERIEAIDRKWRKSELLCEREHTRDMMVNTMIRTADQFTHVRVPGKTEAAALFVALFDKHGRRIASDSDTAETRRIYKLVEDIENNPELTDALDKLALTEVFGIMKDANREFNELWEERNRELGEKDRPNIHAVRTACNKALNTLFDTIEHNSVEYDDIDYLPLAKELNKQALFYRQQLKARATRRINSDKSNDGNIKPPEDSI